MDWILFEPGRVNQWFLYIILYYIILYIERERGEN
jgi:hypothetical protein